MCARRWAAGPVQPPRGGLASWLAVCADWPVPSALPEASLSPFKRRFIPLDGHWEEEAHSSLSKQEALSLPGRPPFQARPLVQPSAGSLHRWGQHRAPAPAPPAVHHAPGGAGRGRRSRGHQLRLWSPPQLLQLLRQLHERSGALQPHEPRQQRPVSSGRRPRPSAHGPVAGCPPAQPLRALGDSGWCSLGRKFSLLHLGSVFSSCRPGWPSRWTQRKGLQNKFPYFLSPSPPRNK